MSDKIDANKTIQNMNVDDFKTRLSKRRNEKDLTQSQLTDILDFTHRSKIATWESTNTNTLPGLYDFYSLCQALDCDPNYLLGYDKLECTNDGIAAEYVHLSPDAVKKLRDDSFLALLIDALITSPKSPLLRHKLSQLCDSGFCSVVPETTFSQDALIRLEEAFEIFRDETVPLNMNYEHFIKYVIAAFPWDRTTTSFEDFLKSILIDEKFQNHILTHPELNNQTDDERYLNLLSDVARISFKYLFTLISDKVIEYDINILLNEMVKDFINSLVDDFKSNYDK